MLNEQDKRAVESMALCQIGAEELKAIFPKFDIEDIRSVIKDISFDFNH